MVDIGNQRFRHIFATSATINYYISMKHFLLLLSMATALTAMSATPKSTQSNLMAPHAPQTVNAKLVPTKNLEHNATLKTSRAARGVGPRARRPGRQPRQRQRATGIYLRPPPAERHRQQPQLPHRQPRPVSAEKPDGHLCHKGEEEPEKTLGRLQESPDKEESGTIMLFS